MRNHLHRRDLVFALMAAFLFVFMFMCATAHAQSSGIGGGIFSSAAASFRQTTFANLSSPVNGSVRYCSDCTATSPCASGGTGAVATLINGTWSCTAGGAGGSGANTALSNLASTAVNASIIPASDNVIDLGSGSAGYAHTYYQQGTYMSWTNSVGPSFYDSNVDTVLTISMAGLGGINRTISVPDVSGQMTVLGNTVTGTGSTLVRATGPTLTTPLASGLRIAVNVKSADYTLTSTDVAVTFDATGAARTATLPACSGTNIGLFLRIKKLDSSVNGVVVTRAGSDLIDGATTNSLLTQYQARDYVCTATNVWSVF